MMLPFALLLAAPLSAQRPLVISGRATLPAGNDGPVMMALIDEIGDTLARHTSTSGRFHFRMDRNEPYTVCFAQPGSITKEVIVDTSHLPPLRRDQRVRHVRFDVVMDNGDPTRRLRYARPVGYIRFRPQAGSVQVVYEEERQVDDTADHGVVQ